MIYYVSANAAGCSYGTAANPFHTITEAARIAQPGDEVIVAPGIYREYVNPLYGGTDDAHRITYRSETPLGAVITGAEEIKDWTNCGGTVWSARIPNRLFGDYNPYTTLISGDWFRSPTPQHTGEVYLNGKSMYERPSLDAVKEPVKALSSWDPDFTVYTWYTCQDGDCTVIYANFQEKDPNQETVEINVRRNCFYPDRTGIGYITLSGFCIRQAATDWAPPTGYQEGMVGPHWSKGWIIEDCEISDSKCVGISLGKYLQPANNNKWTTRYCKDGTQNERDIICLAFNEGWSKETVGSHIIRRCHIHDCGQAGIAGHLGGVFSTIEENHIHHINHKHELIGDEIGGIKLHAAIDVIIRGNHFHHSTRGIWLDWQAQGTRVTQNLFHDHVTPEGSEVCDCEDIFVEVSHGPTLIDNNVFLSPVTAMICTQGIAMVHNLIAGSFTYVGSGVENGGTRFPTPRYTPYHVPHGTAIAGFMTILHGDARFYNNIFVQQKVRSDLTAYAINEGILKDDQLQFTCGTAPYNGYLLEEEYFGQFNAKSAVDGKVKDIYYDHLPIYLGGNIYLNGAVPCDRETDCAVGNEPVTLELEICDGSLKLHTDLYEHLAVPDTSMVCTDTLGIAFEPEQKFEAPDGSPITLDQDYFGVPRADRPLPGPFAAKPENGTVIIK